MNRSSRCLSAAQNHSHSHCQHHMQSHHLIHDPSPSHFTTHHNAFETYRLSSKKLDPPVDINDENTSSIDLPPLSWWGYNICPKSLTLRNTGRTVLVNGQWCQGRPYITGGPLNGNYIFSQVHFHCPSEHEINGKRYPLEMHVVHYKTAYLTQEKAMYEKDGTIVLVYLFQISNISATALSNITNMFSFVCAENTSVELEPFTLDRIFTPFASDYYLYSGSVNTEKNSYLLQWLVYRKILCVSSYEVNCLCRSLDACKGNAAFKRMLPKNDEVFFVKECPTRSSAPVSEPIPSSAPTEVPTKHNTCPAADDCAPISSLARCKSQTSSKMISFRHPICNSSPSSTDVEEVSSICDSNSYYGENWLPECQTQCIEKRKCKKAPKCKKVKKAKKIESSSESEKEKKLKEKKKKEKKEKKPKEKKEKKPKEKKEKKPKKKKEKKCKVPCSDSSEKTKEETSCTSESSSKVSTKDSSKTCEKQCVVQLKESEKDSGNLKTIYKKQCDDKAEKSVKVVKSSKSAESGKSDSGKKCEKGDKKNKSASNEKKVCEEDQVQVNYLFSQNQSKSLCDSMPEQTESKISDLRQSFEEKSLKDCFTIPTQILIPKSCVSESEPNSSERDPKEFSLLMEHLFRSDSRNEKIPMWNFQEYHVAIEYNHNILQEYDGLLQPGQLPVGSFEKLKLTPKYSPEGNIALTDCSVKAENLEEICIRTKFLVKDSSALGKERKTEDLLNLLDAETQCPVQELSYGSPSTAVYKMFDGKDDLVMSKTEENVQTQLISRSVECLSNLVKKTDVSDASNKEPKRKLNRESRGKFQQETESSSGKKLRSESPELVARRKSDSSSAEKIAKKSVEEFLQKKINSIMSSKTNCSVLLKGSSKIHAAKFKKFPSDYNSEKASAVSVLSTSTEKDEKNCLTSGVQINKIRHPSTSKTAYFVYDRIEKDALTGKKVFVGSFRTKEEIKDLQRSGTNDSIEPSTSLSSKSDQDPISRSEISKEELESIKEKKSNTKEEISEVIVGEKRKADQRENRTEDDEYSHSENEGDGNFADGEDEDEENVESEKEEKKHLYDNDSDLINIEKWCNEQLKKNGQYHVVTDSNHSVFKFKDLLTENARADRKPNQMSTSYKKIKIGNVLSPAHTEAENFVKDVVKSPSWKQRLAQENKQQGFVINYNSSKRELGRKKSDSSKETIAGPQKSLNSSGKLQELPKKSSGTCKKSSRDSAKIDLGTKGGKSEAKIVVVPIEVESLSKFELILVEHLEKMAKPDIEYFPCLDCSNCD